MNLAPLLQRLFCRPVSRQETEKQVVGRAGERAAERFLRREKRFRILLRNWRAGKDEIDLICLERDVLVFVEVKTRSSSALVPGYYAVDQRKKEALLRACRQYLKKLRTKPKTFRFDIVEVTIEGDGNQTVRHFENIPLFPKRVAGAG